MSDLLKQKNAVVTGANRGIGRAIVELFAESKANIWACVRTKTPEFESEMDDLAARHGIWIRCAAFDLRNETEIKNAVREIAASGDPVDILVNNAGIAFGGLMSMTSQTKLREVFEVNYFAQINLIQQISKLMIRRKQGVIINMGSVGGIETEPGYLAYGSSKAALIWATKMIARELAPFHIRVNAVAPGVTDTEMGLYRTEEQLRPVLERTPMHRMATPKEIAESVRFLASEQASYITGHILVADGGRL